MRVGSEFLHLCQEQVNLLTRGFGASLAIVALVERPIQESDGEDVVFLPVITYPEAFDSVDPQALRLWLMNIWLAEINQSPSVPYENITSSTSSNGFREDSYDGLLAQGRLPDQSETLKSVKKSRSSETGGLLGPRAPLVSSTQNQIVMPLMYQDVMVGLLVTARVDRGWNQLERYDVERVGQSLAAACVLEQRSQWLEQRLHQQSTTYTRIHEQQQDLLDDVLHQFRNPLTALRTFGKLLVKRLQPMDRNHTVAESIVRESDRLQDLLKQLSMVADVSSIALPSASQSIPEASSHTTVVIPNPSELYSPESNGTEPRELMSSPGQTAYVTVSGQTNGESDECQDQKERGRLDGPLPDPGLMTVKALTGQPIQLNAWDPMAIWEPLLVSAHAIAQERHLELCVTCLEHYAFLWADGKALREVCNNLIDNALKYTPAYGRVDVLIGVHQDRALWESLEAMDGGLGNGNLGNGNLSNGNLGADRVLDDRQMQGMAIADTGPGVPLDDQKHLFERHFRGVQGQGDIPGTGLGLAIAQLLTQQMGGFIQVFSPIQSCPLDELQTIVSHSRKAERLAASHKDGPGTLFIVWLPCHPTASA